MNISVNMNSSEILQAIDILYFSISNQQTIQTKKQNILSDDAIKLLIQTRDKFADSING
jgi:hypothetical protein